MTHKPSNDEFLLKKTKTQLGGGKVTGDKLRSMYDLVEQMQYIYIHVVKARDLPAMDITGSVDPFAEIRLGNFKATTRFFEKESNPEWNQVFAFSRDRIQSSVIEITVKDKDFLKDDFMGSVLFDLTKVPMRVLPESPLAPQWYRLEDKKGNKVKGELMLAVWLGTQADEAFSQAWSSDSANADRGDRLADNRSKVYLLPNLWYLRVNVIEALDLVPSDTTISPEFLVKATLGHQTVRTKVNTNDRSLNPIWNEELMLVAEEPFEEPLILRVEDKNKVVGMCVIPLVHVEQRLDDNKKVIKTRWFDLQNNVVDYDDDDDDDDDDDGEKKKKVKFASKLHMRILLEGGYHVAGESIHYSGDFRPTSNKLWKKSIGTLEVGVLGASGLIPMKTKDGRGTTDAFCVAKYGKKWVRTRTIIDSFTPKWNEQYTWEVFDPCTVITIGVFDNCHLQGGEGRDSKIGKVRINLSALETDTVYTHSYPLLVLHPSGLKKMGEIHLAVRFTCSSLLNMMHMYSQPLLPKMHYTRPLPVSQLDSLRHGATQIMSMRLSRAEPPLRKNVVEYMLDVGESHMWSMRRSKANFYRIMGVSSGLIAALKWFDESRSWKNPITTVLFHFLFVILVMYPQLIMPSVFLSLLLVGVWNYRRRPRSPSHIDSRLSCAENAHPDELDEEFDSFPTSRPSDVVRMRYDRMRSMSGRIQTVAGDVAVQGERIQSLLSWRDPRATTLFMVFCLIAAIFLYTKPLYVVVIQTGLTVLSHPRFQHNLPLAPLNFFRRLPSKSDCML